MGGASGGRGGDAGDGGGDGGGRGGWATRIGCIVTDDAGTERSLATLLAIVDCDAAMFEVSLPRVTTSPVSATLLRDGVPTTTAPRLDGRPANSVVP